MLERLILWHRGHAPRHDAIADEHRRHAAWRRSVSTRLSVAGGSVVAAVGTTVVAIFDPIEIVDVIELALDLLAEADEQSGLEVVLGAAVGELGGTDEGWIGAAIERAQLLANRAQPGELVLDQRARELVTREFLFGRQVSAGAGAARGITVDRRHPRRSASAKAIGELKPAPLPPVLASVGASIEAALEEDRSRTFVLRGPVGAGATELLASLETRWAPERVLRLGAAPGGVVPLASLRLALLRRLGTPDEVERWFGGGADAKAIAAVASGRLVPCAELSGAIASLLGRLGGARPWFVMSPLALVDGATMSALLEARALGADFVLFGRYPIGTPLPRPLGELDETVTELTLPALKTADARVVAQAVLGAGTADDVARRVAVLGGDTVLGVLEAARTLIAMGDLVREGDGFAWRNGPREAIVERGSRRGAVAPSTEEILTQRLELLDGDDRRVLEVLCVVPDGSPRVVIEAVAARDGIGGNSFARSIATISREALVTGHERPRPASSLLRWRVLSLIPPARSMELHRFVGEVLRAQIDDSRAVPLATELGTYLLAGGLEDQAKPLIAAGVDALVRAGYERAARQLSGWAQQFEDERSEGNARLTPTPPPLDAYEEGPPSSEIALDELLTELPPPLPGSSGSIRIPSSLRLPVVDRPPSSPRLPAIERPSPAAADDAAVPAPPVASEPRAREVADSPLARSAGAPIRPPAVLPEPAQRPPIAPPAARLPPRAAPAESAERPPSPPIVDRIDTRVTGAANETARATELDAPASPSERARVAIDRSRPLPTADVSPSSTVEVPFEQFASERPPDAANGPPTSVHPVVPPEGSARSAQVERALRALRERDLDDLDEAIAGGPASPLRAVLELARGDRVAARKTLRHGRLGRDEPSARARAHLAEALIELGCGDPLGAVRAGLAVIAIARAHGDRRAEAAGRHVLAACYRALGDDDRAQRIARASDPHTT